MPFAADAQHEDVEHVLLRSRLRWFSMTMIFELLIADLPFVNLEVRLCRQPVIDGLLMEAPLITELARR
jgi:hypothetical protein